MANLPVDLLFRCADALAVLEIQLELAQNRLLIIRTIIEPVGGRAVLLVDAVRDQINTALVMIREINHELISIGAIPVQDSESED